MDLSATDIKKALFSNDEGNHGIYYGTITGTPTTGAVWKLCKVPAGLKVIRTTIVNADLGTGAPADFGYNHIDGSTGDDADAFGNDLALGTAVASPGTVAVYADAPVEITRDSWIELTFGTIDTGASGAVSVIVEGELFGTP